VRRILRIAAWIVSAIVVVAAIYVGDAALGMRAAARIAGTISGLGVLEPVTIVRDERDVPHITARNEHDMFFAQGYVEGSDRLFQMDVTRRAVEGRLAEVFGRAAVAADERARVVPVERIAQRQWKRLSARERKDLQAFADGVNAAMRTQPLPVEFRLLLYRPQPWRPQDSLVTSFAIVLELTDTWNDIADRSDDGRSADYNRRHPLTDPCYDAPVLDGLGKISESPHCLAAPVHGLPHRNAAGSNAWASGAAHSQTHRAFLANDPHLPPGIPGIWYLVDLRCPGYHVAGATIAGIPGVLLGHNNYVAWGATNGSTASLSIFRPPSRLDPRNWVEEPIRVRFGATLHVRYYRSARTFGAIVRSGQPALHKTRMVLVRWEAYADPRSPFATFDALDRSRSVGDALRALRFYPGPTQNFVIADTSGRVAYQLAGDIPDDPAWARYIHPARDLAQRYPDIAFDRLPRIAPSRNAIVWTANNKMYGTGYPYRLSPEFAPPYRAYRIAQLLKARSQYTVAYFAKMQMDTLSLPERDIARRGGLEWSGQFDSQSRIATAVYAVRNALNRGDNQAMTATLVNSIRNFPFDFTKTAWWRRDVADAQPWGLAGALTMEHPFANMGIRFLNGSTLAGDGDAFTIHVQTKNLSQSFRAVWNVGDWDAGGITLPQGESGEPGSGHYTDEAADWRAGRLLPLPYSKAAVASAARERLTLVP
jgi:penicillin amidase